jgi:hypothetical protein
MSVLTPVHSRDHARISVYMSIRAGIGWTDEECNMNYAASSPLIISYYYIEGHLQRFKTAISYNFWTAADEPLLIIQGYQQRFLI